MPFGLSASGFTPKTLLDIVSELETEFRASFGDSINVDPESSVFGRLIGILAEREALVWDLAQDVYDSQDPDKATGQALDALCALTGTIREPERPSDVVVTCIGDNGVVLPLARQVNVEGSGGASFVSAEEATIITLTAWSTSTTYDQDALVSNAGNVYKCIVAGTSSGVGSGPTSEDASIADGSAYWSFCGEGTAAVNVNFESIDAGAIVATARTLTSIQTPVSGWSSAINILDADLGAEVETDAALRLRREDELQSTGLSPVDAIRAHLLDVDNVTHATVFHNPTDITDVDGLPPHSVECVVLGGTDVAVATAVFEAVAAGIATYGNETENIEDASGNTQSVCFSRPDEIEVYVIIDVVKDPDEFPSDGEDQIKAAIVAYGDALGVGKDVVSMALKARAFSIPGVIDILSCYIDDAPAPTTEDTIVVTAREIAVFDTSRIDVDLSDGSL